MMMMMMMMVMMMMMMMVIDDDWVLVTKIHGHNFVRYNEGMDLRSLHWGVRGEGGKGLSGGGVMACSGAGW
jgi:hypothetical protein